MKGPAIPEKMEYEVSLRGVTLTRTWRSWTLLPLGIFALVWDTFLVGFYSAAFRGGQVHWFAVLFPLGHLCIGVGLTYFVIASLFNRTVIEITSEHVEVRSGPVYWGPRRVIDVSSITDTRVKQTGRTGSRATFGLLYRTPDNREKPLVRGGLSDDQAAFIDHQLRTLLGLTKSA